MIFFLFKEKTKAQGQIPCKWWVCEHFCYFNGLDAKQTALMHWYLRETAIYLMAHGLIEFQTGLDSGQQTSSTLPTSSTFSSRSLEMAVSSCHQWNQVLPSLGTAGIDGNSYHGRMADSNEQERKNGNLYSVSSWLKVVLNTFFSV